MALGITRAPVTAESRVIPNEAGGVADTTTTGITIDAFGSGDPHNNMQPSLALNAIIKT